VSFPDPVQAWDQGYLCRAPEASRATGPLPPRPRNAPARRRVAPPGAAELGQDSTCAGRFGPRHGGEAMELGLAGKVAIVTGASQGIGLATAGRLAAEGARVTICARGEEGLDRLAAAIRDAGGEALPVVADVSKPEDLARLVGATVHAF